MILRGGLILTMYVLAPFYLWAGHYSFTDTCTLAYQAIISLKLNQAQAYINSAKTQDPNNLIPVLLDDYRHFTQLYLGQQQPEDFTAFNAAQNQRLGQLKKGDNKSPWHVYAQAEIQLHGAFAALMNQEYWQAFTSTRRAYKLLEQNQAQYPNFKPNQKSLALLQTILGTVPQKYQWGLKLLGMDGQLIQGMNTLKTLSHTNWLFQTETTIYYAMLLSHLHAQHQEAWQLMVEKGYPLSGNKMSYLVAADIAFYSKHTDAVIDIVNRAPKDTSFAPLPILQYYKGMAQLRKMDSSGVKTLQKFIPNGYPQTANYQNSASLHLAWWFLIQGDTTVYKLYIKNIQLQDAGRTEADKMAHREATRKDVSIHNAILVKARMLYDGGYYKEALQTLGKFDPTKHNSALQTEYLYRKGRVYDDLGQDSLALEHYRQTIELGEALPYYYAGNAALKAGEIYERQGNKTMARQYYNKCLSIAGHEYEDSLHQKARAGLERLN